MFRHPGPWRSGQSATDTAEARGLVHHAGKQKGRPATPLSTRTSGGSRLGIGFALDGGIIKAFDNSYATGLLLWMLSKIAFPT
ncbi:hypothetical protein [Xylella taiwanensis]|nr:hypothetical protein [Xylella taiwanensis]